MCIRDRPPSLINKIEGCSFAPRCPNRDTECNPSEHMRLVEVNPDHFADICSQGK